MAKKPKRKFRRYIRGGIEDNIELGTLGAKALISTPVSDVVTERTWLSSVVCSWTLTDFTNAADDGPILVGVAHSDYTDAEIEAFIEQSTSWDEGDLVSQEIARRKIRIIGSLATNISDASLKDGEMVKTMCKWILTTGNNIDLWAYNQGSTALTDGAVVNVAGHANLFPT